MKKNNILLMLFLLGNTVQAQNWPEIKPEARPGSRWWWMGSAVDPKGLAYNLHKYGTAGIGSLEITPIYGVKGNEQRDIPFCHPDGWKCTNTPKTKHKRTVSTSI